MNNFHPHPPHPRTPRQKAALLRHAQRIQEQLNELDLQVARAARQLAQWRLDHSLREALRLARGILATPYGENSFVSEEDARDLAEAVLRLADEHEQPAPAPPICNICDEPILPGQEHCDDDVEGGPVHTTCWENEPEPDQQP